MKKTTSLVLLLTFMQLFGAYMGREEAISKLQTANPQEYASADELVVYNEKVTLNDSCTGTVVWERFRKVLNENSKKDNSVRFFYNINYDSIKVQAIEIIKQDGRIVSLNPAEVLKLQDNSFSGGANIYSKLDKVLTTELPGLEIGDIVFTKSKEIIRKARMAGEYSNSLGIENYSPYLNNYLSIEMPAKKMLYIHELNKTDTPYDFKQQTKEGRTTYEWTSANKEVILYEPSMDSWNHTTYHLKITTIKSWEEISRWYAGLVDPHMKINQAIKDKVSELTKGVSDRKEKAAKIFYWVAHEIRYLGVDGETNRPGYEPHDVTYTFETRGGVCRDKAALLCAMLREAGIGSDVSLISAGERLNYEAPVVWFNHAITVAYDENGKFAFWLDPTNENTRDFLPKYEEDNTFLIASKTGVTLQTTPVSKPVENNSTLNIKLDLDNQNNAQGSAEFLFSGYNDTVIRGWFAEMNPSKIRETIEMLLKRIHPSASISELTVTKAEDKTQNFKITAKMAITNYAKQSSGLIYIPFSATDLKMHLMYQSAMWPYRQNERKYNFKLNGAMSFDTNIELTLPFAAQDISIPEAENLDYLSYKTSLSTEKNGKKLKFGFHLENSEVHFKKESYKELKEKLTGLAKAEKFYIIGKIN